MGEIYLKIDSSTNRVILVHEHPFDNVIGLINTGETVTDARIRLLLDGVFVPEIPPPSPPSTAFRSVLKYSTSITGYNSSNPETGCHYAYYEIPSGDTILLDTIKNVASNIKSFIPNSILIHNLAVNTTSFDISSLFVSNYNFGVNVNKNGRSLSAGSEFSVTKTGQYVELTIFGGISPQDYAIVAVCDNLSEHLHNIADINSLTSQLANKANTVHTHVITDVNNLTNELNDRALVDHSHELSDLVSPIATDTKYGLVKISDEFVTPSSDTAASITAVIGAMSDKADENHEHPYLSINGGEMLGPIAFRTLQNVNNGVPGGEMYLGSDTVGREGSVTRLNYNGYLYTTKTFNAAYNDLAECFIPEDDIKYAKIKNRIVEINEEGKIRLASKLSDKVIGVVSDKYGYLLGGSEEEILKNEKIPVGLSGTLWIETENTELDDLFIGGFVCSNYLGTAKIIPKGESVLPKYEGTIVGKIIQIDKNNCKVKVILMLK